MAAFKRQLSSQVSELMKQEIKRILLEDLQNGLAHEADVVRLGLDRGLPLIAEMSPTERLRAYAELRRAAEDAERASQAAEQAAGQMRAAG